jgi:chromosomal replication initiation ATPase DnaA
MGTLEGLAALVCRATGFSIGEIRSRDRRRGATNARMLLCHAARSEGFSTPEIGQFVGRNHSTVVSGTKVFRNRLEVGDKMAKRCYRDFLREYEKE